MGKWLHRLTDINKEMRIAVCSNCGPVKVKKQGNSYRCSVAKHIERRGIARPQDVLCEVCLGDVRVAYDHSHSTGRFRGWLCMKCNTILGLANEDPKRLLNLADYLRAHP